MAEQHTSSVILDTLGLILRGIRSVQWLWYLSWVGRILAFPFRILLLPVLFFGRVLLVVFSPVVLIFSYITSLVSTTIDFLISLEPLYTLFGSAAFIGIIAGIVLGVSSTLVTSYLGMRDDPLKQLKRTKSDDLLDVPLTQEEESSSNETEWQWLERSPSRRRPAPGLMSQTIHEEEDDSDAAF